MINPLLTVKAAIALALVCAASTAQAGIAEQSLTHANAKVRAAVLHDVCEVHGNEKRDQARRRGPRLVTPQFSRSWDVHSIPTTTRRWRRRHLRVRGDACKSPRPNRISPDPRATPGAMAPSDAPPDAPAPGPRSDWPTAIDERPRVPNWSVPRRRRHWPCPSWMVVCWLFQDLVTSWQQGGLLQRPLARRLAPRPAASSAH